MMSGCSAAGQLRQCLGQLAATDSSTSVTALEALLRVKVFASTAAEAACEVSFAVDGHLELPVPQQECQQPSLDNAAPQQEQISYLLATLLAQLSLQQQLVEVSEHILQHLLPEVLQCQHTWHGDERRSAQHAVGSSPSSRNWLELVCSTAAQLHAHGHPAAQQLTASCVQQLEALTSSPAGPVSSMTFGGAACLQLLAAVLQPHGPVQSTPSQQQRQTAASGGTTDTGLQPELLNRLLACVVPQVAAGHPLSKALQATLIMPLMAAAAATASDISSSSSSSASGSAAYSEACVQLLHAVCGCVSSKQPQTAAAGPELFTRQQDSSRISESLALACRLQPHMLEACRAAGPSCSSLLHGLILEGLRHGDLHCRQRAVHLLDACVAAGCAPKVLRDDQWGTFSMLYRAEEQHMLHLIQPLWEQYFSQLWQGRSSNDHQQGIHTAAHQAHQQQEQHEQQTSDNMAVPDAGFQLVQWCGVLVLRAAFHSNVGVKRLGLSGFLQLPSSTLQQLCWHGGWPALQELLLLLLPAFTDRKLVSQAAGGSASRRQADAIATLKQQLVGFLSSCIQLLQDANGLQQPQDLQLPKQQQPQHQQQQLVLCESVLQFLQAYLEQVTATGDRAAALLLLLQALADAVTTAAAVAAARSALKPAANTSSNIQNGLQPSADSQAAGSSARSHSSHVLHTIVRALAHAEFVHPAYLRPAICRALLQLVPCCLSTAAVTPADALLLLAASSALVSSGAEPCTGLLDAQQQQQQELVQHVQQAQQVLAAGGFLCWLQAALGTQLQAGSGGGTGGEPHSCAEAVSLTAELFSSRAGGAVGGAQQHHAALYLLGMLAADLDPALQQQLVAAIVQVTTGGQQKAAAIEREDGASGAAGSQTEAQQQHQHQQQHNSHGLQVYPMTACAWLVAGFTAALAAPSAQPQQQELLAACAAQVLPVLLQHHLSAISRPGAIYDQAWCGALIAAVAAAATRVELRAVVLKGLAHWLPHLSAWLAAAADPQASLQDQLLLLGSAHICCYAFQPGPKPISSGSSGSSTHGHDSSKNGPDTVRPPAVGAAAEAAVPGCHQMPLDVGVVSQCLELLCELQPAQVTTTSAAAGSTGAPPAAANWSRMELTDTLLQLHASLLDQLVSAAAAAAAAGLTADIKEVVFNRCLQDLEWSSQHTLQQLLHVLLLTAPYPPTLGAPQHQDSRLEVATAVDTSGQSIAIQQLQSMLELLVPLVRNSSSSRKRLSAHEVLLLAQVFFHPALFACRELQPMLCQQLLPIAFAQGGMRLSVAVMTHLCSAVLGPHSHLLEDYLNHITHMAVFSLFAESVSQAAALQQQKCDAAVLLPSRVVLCAFLVQLAKSGAHASFTVRLVERLLSIAQAAEGQQYSWLASREAAPSSGANAIKVAVWQTLCLLAPHIPEDSIAEALRKSWSCLLASHQHGNIRPHVQLFLLVLLSRQPAAVPALLLPALEAFNTSSYQVTVSIIILGMFVLLELGPDSPQFMPLLHALLPWALHHRHAVRVPVQVMLHVTFKRHMQAIQLKLGEEAVQLLREVRRFLVENDEVAKLRERQALVDLEGFDLGLETSLEGVFGVREDQLEALCDGEADRHGLLWPLHCRDRLPLDLLSLVPGAVRAVGDRRGAAAGAVGGAASPAQEASPDGAGEDAGQEDVSGPGSAVTMHQFRPQIQGSLFDDAAADRATALAAERASRPGLILCASLLDNLPNLAGLCRTCESLSAEALVLASRAVVNTDAFKKQSRTSERWLRILEVGQPDVATFLQEQRAAGYTIIGVEQATNSVPLHEYPFPQRCVVVLGNEQNGMPAAVLPLLDVCVEIPMLGVTRSLNAHVSGAMVMWEYVRSAASRVPSAPLTVG